MDVRDKVVIIADTRHFQRLSERKIDPTLCKEDLAFFCNCPTTVEHLRLWAHERTLGIPRNVDDLERIEFADVLGAINEDPHLTRCTQVCFTGTEEDQAEQSDQETIDEVLGEQDMEEGRNFLEEADREKLIYLSRRLLLVTQSQRKRLAPWLRPPRRVRVAIRRLHRNLRHLPRQVLVQMLRAGAETTETTKRLRTDSPAGDVDSHNIVCSCYVPAQVSRHSCDFTNGYFQGQEIDRILLCRVLLDGFPGEGTACGEIPASRVPVYGTKDTGHVQNGSSVIEPNSDVVHAPRR